MSNDHALAADAVTPPGRTRRFAPENRYGLVLLLIAITYAVSAANTGTRGQLAVVAIQLTAVWLIFTVAGSRRVRHIAGVALILLAVASVVGGVLGWASSDTSDIDPYIYVLNAALYLLAPIMILISLVRRRVVDLQTFLGAISAYLLLGMMFAFTYHAVGQLQGGPPFFGEGGDGTMSEDLFFSFVTLTTTGYGNLVPTRNPGQSLAVVEAIAGQLFLVTAVAKVVTSWQPALPRSGSSRAPDRPDAP